MFSTRSGAVKLSYGVVIGLIALKVVVSLVTGSISILAQTIDSSLDLFAITIIFFALRVASHPADEEHPFGHGKVEGIAATVQALLILVAGGSIIYSAVLKIIHGAQIAETEAGIAVMAVSAIASLLLSRHLKKVAKATDSIALESYAGNIAADVYSTSGVLLGLVIIRFTGLTIIDPILAIGVALLILKAGFEVMRKSFGELVDVKLPPEEEKELLSYISRHDDRIMGFHAVRTRKAGNTRFIDLHLVMPRNVSVEEAHRICDHLEEGIKHRLSNASVTIHVEPCDSGCRHCGIVACDIRHN